MDKEKNFAGGIVFKRHEKTPEFVIVNMGININDFVSWANKNADQGWVNIVVKKSKSGKIYGELDTYKKDPSRNDKGFEKQVGNTMTSPGYDGEPAINTEDIPF